MGVSSQYVASSSSIADGAVSEAKLAAEACSAAKMKKEGTSGQVLTSNGTGAVPSYQAVSTPTTYFELIERQTLSGTSNSIAFSSLGSYKQYVLYYKAKVDGNMYGTLRLNADSGANYYGQYLNLANTTVSGSRGTGDTGVNFSNGAANGNTLTGIITIINDNSISTGYRQVHSQHGFDTGSQYSKQEYFMFMWKSDDALSSINITTSANNFTAGSSFALYGLK